MCSVTWLTEMRKANLSEGKKWRKKNKRLKVSIEIVSRKVRETEKLNKDD